jgi:hypothetical protein
LHIPEKQPNNARRDLSLRAIFFSNIPMPGMIFLYILLPGILSHGIIHKVYDSNLVLIGIRKFLKFYFFENSKVKIKNTWDGEVTIT